jgi:hypothetical protein
MDNIDSTTPEPATPFVYPDEQVQTVVEDANIRKLLDFLMYYVLTDKNPQLCLLALGYNSGYDIGNLYNCPNTARGISKAVGITHVVLHKKCKEIEEHLGLKARINNDNKRPD